jgi:hypothetical protein
MQETARTAPMQLIAQDLGDILTALRAAQDTKGHERRNSARMEVQAQVKVVPFEDGVPAEPFTCMTRDVSFKGIGLLQSRQPPRGSQFVVTLPKRGGESMSILCTVMYCRVLADGIYNVGAAFQQPYDFNAPPAVEFRHGSSHATGKNANGSARQGGGGGAGERELDRIRQSILR